MKLSSGRTKIFYEKHYVIYQVARRFEVGVRKSPLLAHRRLDCSFQCLKAFLSLFP